MRTWILAGPYSSHSTTRSLGLHSQKMGMVSADLQSYFLNICEHVIQAVAHRHPRRCAIHRYAFRSKGAQQYEGLSSHVTRSRGWGGLREQKAKAPAAAVCGSLSSSLLPSYFILKLSSLTTAGERKALLSMEEKSFPSVWTSSSRAELP